MIRIGHGFDVHAFGEDRPLIIGGVEVPYHTGFIAHSDGDVALHALTDMQYKNADSRVLLREAFRQVQEKGYKVGNVDVTIIAQAPKMRPHIDAMRAKIAEDLHCDIEQVNVKATTTEKLGFTGRSEGIACEAVALLLKA